jgi:hypothetical protein
MAKSVNVSDESLERGMQLLGKSEEDIVGYLGYLDGEHETYLSWQGKPGIVAPEWDEEEKWLEFTAGAERGAVNDWLQVGSNFLKDKVVPYVKGAICENGDCRKEIKDLEDDLKGLIKYLVGVIGGFLTVSMPAAAVSISVVIAVLIIKKGVRNLCKE